MSQRLFDILVRPYESFVKEAFVGAILRPLAWATKKVVTNPMKALVVGGTGYDLASTAGRATDAAAVGKQVAKRVADLAGGGSTM